MANMISMPSFEVLHCPKLVDYYQLISTWNKLAPFQCRMHPPIDHQWIVKQHDREQEEQGIHGCIDYRPASSPPKHISAMVDSQPSPAALMLPQLKLLRCCFVLLPWPSFLSLSLVSSPWLRNDCHRGGKLGNVARFNGWDLGDEEQTMTKIEIRRGLGLDQEALRTSPNWDGRCTRRSHEDYLPLRL